MDALGPALIEFGLPGIIIAALGWACWRLYLRVNELQDKRVEDTREVVETINSNTVAFKELATLIRDRRSGV